MPMIHTSAMRAAPGELKRTTAMTIAKMMSMTPRTFDQPLNDAEARLKMPRTSVPMTIIHRMKTPEMTAKDTGAMAMMSAASTEAMPAASSERQGKPLWRAVFALRMVRTPSTTSQAPMKIPMAAAMGAGAAISSTPRTTARTPRTMTTQNTPLLTECRSDRAWSRGSGTPEEYRGSLGVRGDDI